MSDQEQLDSAWTKIQAGLQRESEGRELWVEGTLALIQVLDEGRKSRDNSAFSQWLREMGYGANRINTPDRLALLNMAMDLEVTRKVLEQTARRSYQYIWKEEVRFSLLTKLQGKSDKQISIEEVTRFPDKATTSKMRYAREAKERQERFRLLQEQREQEKELREKELRAKLRQEERQNLIHERAKEIFKEKGWELGEVNVYSPEPVGRMPDDIREKYNQIVQEVLCKLEALQELGRYRDQMHPDLRHVLVEGPKSIKMWAEKLAKEMIGGNGDLRKVRRFLCDEEIPLRVEDGAQ